MTKDSRTDPRLETSLEIQALKKINGHQKSVSEYWDDRFEKVYSEVLENVSEMGRHGVIAEIINRSLTRGNILDVGCGTGILSELIDLQRFQYLGIDVSEVALRMANEKRKKSKVDFLNTKIEYFKPQHKFNIIVFNEVLYYLDYENVIKQISDWFIDQKIIITSIFDFQEGHLLKKWLESHSFVISEIIIENQKDNLKWYVNTLKL